MENSKKILIIRFSSLGDVALTTPIYRNIKEAMPDAHISVLVKDEFSDLLDSNPYIDELIRFNKHDSLFSIIKTVRKKGFHYVIDLHANLRSSIITLFSKAKNKVTYKKDILARRLFVSFRKNDPRLQLHTIEKYLDTLKIMGIPIKHKNPEIYFGKHTLPKRSDVKKILIVQTAFIGDIVLTVPIAKAIKEKQGDIELHMLTTPQGKDMLENSAFLDRVLVYDKKGKDRSLKAFFNLIASIRKEKYDLALIPHRSFKSALMMYLAGIKERIGFENSQGKMFLTKILPFTWSMHDLERNNLLLMPLGIDIEKPNFRLDIPADYQEDIMNKLNKLGINKYDTVIGINPGSVWETKRWPSACFRELITRIINEIKCKVIVFGGRTDLYFEEELKGAVNSKNVVSLIGKTTLRDLTQFIARCNIFVTNDSGPMHIAVGLDVATIAIFGATTRDLGFYPYGNKHRIIEVKIPCRPCGLHGKKRCPKGHFNCMKLITVDRVFDEIKNVLELSKVPIVSNKG
ncbi:MAG: lipopolysaccharide heptosyltransferase II [bacterium]